MQRHRIACGDARTFQGKERDIMFLSMVSAPNRVGAPLSRDTFAQRFNVAASRARDRMYLVRSVELEHLSDADRLRRSLIAHFSAPFAQDETRVEDLRSLCESPFEREMYDELTQRGYWVTPQVRVGQYRIDMVVEGHDDARLAVECDGDKYHGPDKWADDMQRQRVLERAGWIFWRCFASAFIRRRSGVMDDLLKTLTERGIEAIGAEGAPRSVHTEQRRISTLAERVPSVEEEAPNHKGEPVVELVSSLFPPASSLASNGPSAKNRLSAVLAMDIPTLQNLSRRASVVLPKVESQVNSTPLRRRATTTDELGPNDEELFKFCNKHGLKTRDMRYKKGALWVYHVDTEDDIARQLTQWGFQFALGKGYWHR